MKALRFENDQVAVTEIPRPDGKGEALVRVTRSGICNTDLEIVRGYAGFTGTIGHEFVGVAETAPGRPDLVGQRVVGEINAGCGHCALCRGGDTRHCPTRTVLGIVGRDGAHAEFLSLPAINLLPVPDNVSDEQAVFVEPLAAALGILERVLIAPTDKVAVIGDGKLGLLCAQAVATTGANVTIIGKHAEKMRLVETRGIETVLLDAAAKRANSFDVVVEASGQESGFNLGLDLLQPRGTLVLKSTFQGEPTWPAARVVVDEYTIVGSRCGRFAPALELLNSGGVDVTSMITEEYSLADGVRALNRARQPGMMKILLRP
ncbi:MAG: alcohol dehydrogenase catalytic domain-containing protein [Pyrinomonadaceae bacterium]